MEAEPGPEFADATCDEVGVAVEGGGIVEGVEGTVGREVEEVLDLAGDDFAEDVPDGGLEKWVEAGEPGEEFWGSAEEVGLGEVRLGG